METQRVYEGNILNLRVDKISFSNGNVGTREIVEHDDCVCMVPIDNQNNVVLVSQYRKSVEETLLEVPAGGVETGELSEDAVLRELQEETGYTADNLQLLSSFWTTPGFCTELMHSYLATGLRESTRQGDEDEEDPSCQSAHGRNSGDDTTGSDKRCKEYCFLTHGPEPVQVMGSLGYNCPAKSKRDNSHI